MPGQWGTGCPQAGGAMPSPSRQAQSHHAEAEAAAEGRGRWTRALALGKGAPAALWALLQKPSPLKPLQSERWVCFLPAKHALGVI